MITFASPTLANACADRMNTRMTSLFPIHWRTQAPVDGNYTLLVKNPKCAQATVFIQVTDNNLVINGHACKPALTAFLAWKNGRNIIHVDPKELSFTVLTHDARDEFTVQRALNRLLHLHVCLSREQALSNPDDDD